jgi:Brp/Blh family beta-carotene 15,15'-monooxygenase
MPRLIVFALFTALACGQSLWILPGPVHRVLLILALAGIAIAIWHGAYDGVLARPLLKPRLHDRWALTFAAGYVLLAGVVLAVWHVAPECALVGFLAYSSWHFGTEKDTEPLTPGAAVLSFAAGAAPIAAACHWHPEQVSALFGAMLGSAAGRGFAQQLTGALGAALWGIVALVALGATAEARAQSRQGAMQQVCLVVLNVFLFRCCDPVIAFAIYFCVWHTPEHLISSSRDGDGCYSPQVMLRNLRAGILPWIASLAGFSVLLAWRKSDLTAGVPALFLLLSALTVPHMALNEVRRFVRVHPERNAIAPATSA